MTYKATYLVANGSPKFFLGRRFLDVFVYTIRTFLYGVQGQMEPKLLIFIGGFGGQLFNSVMNRCMILLL